MKKLALFWLLWALCLVGSAWAQPGSAPQTPTWRLSGNLLPLYKGGTNNAFQTAANYAVFYLDTANSKFASLDPGTDGYVLTTHGSSGPPTWESPTGALGLDPTAGNIYYGDGTNVVALPAGTDGQILTLVSGLPSWQDCCASGGSGGFTAAYHSSDFTASYQTINYVDTSGGAVTMTIPTAVGHDAAEIKAVLVTAGNTFTITTTGGEQISGAGSITTNVRYDAYTLCASNTNATWYEE